MFHCKLLKKSCHDFNSAVKLNLLTFDSQINWLADYDGKILMNYIGRFENLDQDFKNICKKINLPKIELKHQNKTTHKHYCECYDEESIEIIKKKFEEDIKVFNYEF